VPQTGDPIGPPMVHRSHTSQRATRGSLEIMVPGEDSRFYNQTCRDLGIFKAPPCFFAYKWNIGLGTLRDKSRRWARPKFFCSCFGGLTPARPATLIVSRPLAAFG